MITGPFSREKLLQMYRQGVIDSQAKLSFDKINQLNIYEALNIIVPDLPPESVLPPDDVKNCTPPPSPPPADMNPTAVPAETAKLPAERLVAYKILSDTVGTLFALEKCSSRLRINGVNVMVISAVFAVVTGLFLTVSAGLLYSRFYEVSPGTVLTRGFTWVLLNGTVVFTVNTLIHRSGKPGELEEDFMTAAHCIMHSGAFLIVVHAVAFLLNPKLFDWSISSIFTAFFIALLPALFFLNNILQTLRRSFSAVPKLNGTSAVYLSGIALWLMLGVFGLLQSAIYNFN